MIRFFLVVLHVVNILCELSTLLLQVSELCWWSEQSFGKCFLERVFS